jgi:monoterpene epsilon-lactone hydrolase
VDADISILDLRARTEKAGRLFGRLPTGIVIEPATIAGRYAEWVIPEKGTRDKLILYFHGGGYVIGSPQGHRIHVAKAAKRSGLAALVIDYRLAPEHPFPAAIDDSVSAYRWLLAQGHDAGSIAFMGDSAGGGLCLATLLALKDQGIELPKAAVALSPWTDLACTGDSLTTNAPVDHLTWKGSWAVFSRHYLNDANPREPLASPLYGDLGRLPPLFIVVGSDELLRDDSLRFAERAQQAGVDVTLRVGAGMFHCYPVCAPLFPEATEAMDEIASFLRGHLGT